MPAEEELDLSVPSSSYSSEEELDLPVPSSIYSSEEFQRRKSLLDCLIGIVVEHTSKLSSQHGHVIDLLGSLKHTSKFEYNDTFRNNFKTFVSLGKDLKVLFTVPNQQIMSHISLHLNSYQVVAAFINFHLLMVEVILYFKAGSIARAKGSVQNLQTELGFLITFLGDTALHLQPTKNILTDIEAMVNDVGRFLYFFYFTIILLVISMKKGTGKTMTDFEATVNEVGSFWLHKKFFDLIEDITLQTTKDEERNKKNGKRFEVTNKAMMGIKALVSEIGSFLEPSFFMVTESGELDLALSNLLTKFELLKTKIKEHCITVSKMTSDMTPKTAVVSPFIVDSVLDDLMNLINNKTEMAMGVEDQIVTVHKELMSLGSSVTDIAVQQEAELEELMIQTRDIAYEVEYVINSFPQVWYLALRLPRLIEKIQLIKMAIKKRNNNIDAAGMPEVANYSGEQVSSQSTKYPAFRNTVVGFEKVATEIVEQLVRGPDQRQIISIIGMPGVGKTTLANILYNNPSVVCHFDRRSWGVVSQTYNKKKILIEILCTISHSERETFKNMDEESLAEKLYKSLKGLRYLIVIDDIWDINVWNDLERYFPDGMGSRILFTTRNKEVGLIASPHRVINELPLLSDAKSWELLQVKVFEDEKCPQELLEIGKQIATNCHGLPLAVVIIAEVLENMEKKEHLWQEVERNLSSHLLDNPNNFMQILELSYEHLPNHLKPCFLYFGAFEQDVEIPVRLLIPLWVAEGFIKKEELKCLEDVALKYLMELIDRSLVLVSRRRYNGEVKTCKVHELLLEMCSRIGGKKKFLKKDKYDVTSNEDDLPTLFSQVSKYWQHHCVTIDSGKSPIYSLPSGLHMRSLLCDGDNPDPTTIITSSYKVLRVFFLSRSKHIDDFVLIGIEHMVNLRFLAIPSVLPPMESFHKLEFLFVDNSHPVEIPDVMLTMMSLRRMYFEGGAYFSASCRRQAAMEQSFQISNNIQSISVLEISVATDVKILRCCPNLRTVKCRFELPLYYSIDSLNQLISLKLILRYPSSGSFSLPLNLKELTLIHVKMSMEQIDIIGGLLNLEVLKLDEVYFHGAKWNVSSEFPRLKFLKLIWVHLEEWNASSDNFPSLEGLALQYCKRLKKIPSSLGEIFTLQKIEVYKCAESVNESAEQIQEEQQDMGNEVLKVIISRRIPLAGFKAGPEVRWKRPTPQAKNRRGPLRRNRFEKCSWEGRL